LPSSASIGLSLGDLRVAAHLGRAHAADRVEVADVVGDVLDLECVEGQTEVRQIVLGLLGEACRERLLVLVHLLGRQAREHAAEVALERLAGDVHDLRARLAEEALDRVVDERLLAGHLDVRDALHGEGDAALGVGPFDLELDDHVREVHRVHRLEQRDPQGAAALHDAVGDLLALRGAPRRRAREDEHLVRRTDVEDVPDEDQRREDGRRREDEEDEQGEEDGHQRSPSFEPEIKAGTSTPVESRSALMTAPTILG
jgi:hypothetical protein